MDTLFIHFNGFWGGFFEKTNPTHVGFFLQLLEKVYERPVDVGTFENSTILVENTQATSVRAARGWMHTYLFSGESYIRSDGSDYSCVLFGTRSHHNVVNVPLYIPYIVSSFDESVLTNTKQLTIVPPKDALVVVSNPTGTVRNKFCEALEKHMSVTYAGHFKNNIGGPIPYAYNSKEFRDFVSQFKFVVSMENSQEETYITEKITHGLIGGSIPVYWGSKRVAEYFNKDRILTVDDETCIDAVVQTMKTMNADTWLQKANSRCLPQGRGYGVNDIARQIKSVFYPNPFPLLTHIYIICNPEFEPVRHQRLQQMCAAMGLREHNYTFICPTYKHTITDDMYKEYVKNDLVVRMRPAPMKRSELSLFLNFRAVFEHAVMHYKEGMVLTLESDVYLKPNYGGLGQCLEVLQNKQWDCIHLGGASPSEQPVPFINGETPYRAMPNAALLTANSSEELSPHEELRFSRRFHTRCTDTLLWKMSGCESFLRHMQNDTNYGAPFDYYFINKLENDMSFKHYWSYISYFDQASNNKLEPSTIQSDMS